MKPAAFEYERASDLNEAVNLLAQLGYDGKVIAGGQSLLPMMNLRLTQPACLVDITAIETLRDVEDRGDSIGIGAGVTHARIEDGAVPGRLGQIMAAVSGDIAYRAVRTRGTIGGSLAHADPAADWPCALLALDAEIEAVGPAGKRVIPLADFLQGAFMTTLAADEIIERIAIPKPSSDAKWSYYKFCRKPGDFSEATGAVLIDQARGIRNIVLGATHSSPAILSTAGDDGIGDAVAATAPGMDVYEQHIHRVAVERALREAEK